MSRTQLNTILLMSGVLCLTSCNPKEDYYEKASLTEFSEVIYEEEQKNNFSDPIKDPTDDGVKSPVDDIDNNETIGEGTSGGSGGGVDGSSVGGTEGGNSSGSTGGDHIGETEGGTNSGGTGGSTGGVINNPPIDPTDPITEVEPPKCSDNKTLFACEENIDKCVAVLNPDNTFAECSPKPEDPTKVPLPPVVDSKCSQIDGKYFKVEDVKGKGQIKVKICHQNKSKSLSIIIACPALKAHLDHHDDYLGYCVDQGE